MRFKRIFILSLILIFFGFFSYTLQDSRRNEERILSSSGGVLAQEGENFGFSLSLPFSKNRLRDKIKNQEPINILLLGYGGLAHAGAYLTDTIILGQLDPSSKKIKLVNIPRDLWIGGRKINSLYSDRQSAEDVIEVLEKNFEISIDFWGTADFDGFRKLINELDGVEIDVEKTFDDYNYPRHDSDWIDPGVMHIHFDEGWQIMDGERALQYARSRYSPQDGGDFNRSRRQQQVLLAIKEKILQERNPFHFFTFYQIAKENFSTDLSLTEIWTLLNYFKENENSEIENKILSTENFLYSSHTLDGAYILLPQGGSFEEIQEYLDF